MYTDNKFGMYNSWPDKRYLLLTLQFILLLTLFVINTLASSILLPTSTSTKKPAVCIVVQLLSIERGKYSFLAFKCMNFLWDSILHQLCEFYMAEKGQIK